MDLQLAGHTAVVTGGASGIGRAVVDAFLAEDCRVVVWDVASPVDALSVSCEFKSCDVSSMSSVDAAARSTLEYYGEIDHVVHAAAVSSGYFGHPFNNVPVDAWQRVLDVNVRGAVHLAHAMAPAMQARKAGTIIFVASVAGQIGSQTDPPYSASKAANINFAQCLAKDLAPFHVRVNTVCPGMVQTPLNRSVWQAWADQQSPATWKPYEDWANEKVRNVVPLGRWQTPSDVANMIVFLSSSRAAQVTGQTINVDGGFVMHW